MTRTGRWCLALTVALFGATAWAGDEKVIVPELLPAPQSCCQDSCCSKSDCCKSGSCPACEAKHEKSGLETRVFNVGPLLTWDQASGERATELIKLIQAFQPQTWAACECGGAGTIEYYPQGRCLVVNQTTDKQVQIAELLRALQRLQTLTSAPIPPPATADMPAGMFLVAVPPPPTVGSALSSPEAHAVAAPQPSFCPFQLLNTKEETSPFAAPCPMASAGCQPNPAANCFGVFFGHAGEVPTSGIAPAAMIQAVPPPPVMLSGCKMMNVPQAPNSSCWRLQALTVEGKTRLAVHCDCNLCMTCENVEIAVAGTNKLKIAAGDGKICIQNPDLQATADAISCQGQTGCLVLEGHVNLRYEKNGQHAIVTAQHVMLNLKTGQLDMQAASGGSIQFDAVRVQGGIQ